MLIRKNAQTRSSWDRRTRVAHRRGTPSTYTILYYAILYYTMPYHTIPYHTIPYHTILYYTILYYTILYYQQGVDGQDGDQEEVQDQNGSLEEGEAL